MWRQVAVLMSESLNHSFNRLVKTLIDSINRSLTGNIVSKT